MVYTGKPSRGCQTCKTRRIRCDEVRPSCGNCRKSGRTCPGFPDEFDLIFRNENAAVARRTKRAASKQKASPTTSSSSPSTESSQQSPQQSANQEINSLPVVKQTTSNEPPEFRVLPQENALQAFFAWRGPSLPQGLHFSIEAQATAFFFRNFVLPPQQKECERGFFDILLPYFNETPEASPLHLATHAVSLAVLGNYPGRAQLMREAARFYGQALQKAQLALKDPAQAKSDETLLTIMMFVLYETLHNANYSITAWAHHIDGAVTLTKLRGRQQLEQPKSRKLFQAVRAMMLTNAMQRCEPVEEFPGVPGWTIQEENPANRLTVISMGLPALRSRVRALMSNKVRGNRIEEAWSLIAAARKVDSDLQEWANSLSDNWAHRTIAYTTEMPTDVRTAERWIGPVHAYADVWTSHIWNDYRITRVFTLSIIMACCSVISPKSTDLSVKALLANAHFISQGLIDDLCASVPFHMSFDLQNRVIQADQDREAAEALGGFLLVWHVFVAANVECIPEHQRAWLQGRLLHIGREFGLSHAQMLGMAERHILMHGDTPNLQAPNFSMVDPTTVGYSDLPPTMGAIGAGHFFTTAEVGQRGQQWQRQWHGRVDEVMGGEETTEEARPQAPQMEKVTVQV
ncbi:hypothetical protein MPH_13007 [Macrophomina phaseolina MS6]|uniref:Zn(2)-C6 fungal-type domain-containing protein n=1 Tax=Macrophomina phaseolina (strain MS6) TaxID=1126212 RepID=K2RAK4_MACPH|nr:hypothetical protein MPH_13007 [Macrophomina phaseolina MS6]